MVRTSSPEAPPGAGTTCSTACCAGTRSSPVTHVEDVPARPGRHGADWPRLGPGPADRRWPRGASRRPWQHQAAAAALAWSGRSGGGRHRHGLGQVAGLPAAGADRAARRRAGDRALPGADQGARRRPAALASARSVLSERPGGVLRRRHRAAGAGLGARARPARADQPGHAAPRHPARAQPVGRASCAGCATWWSTSATPTAGSSARTSPRCCAGCGGSAPRTAPTRSSCSPRRRSATPAESAGRLTGVPVAEVTEDASPRGAGRLRAVGAAADRRPAASTERPSAGRPAPRPPSCSPTWWSRTPGRWPSSAPGAARRRSPLSGAPPAAGQRAGPGRPGRRVPGGLPARGAPGAGGGAGRRELLGVASHQRAGAGRGHRRPGRGRSGRLPGHAGLAVAAGRPGRPGRAAVRWPSSSPGTTRWTPTWCTTRRRCSAGRSEATVLDPDNPYVLGPQLCCAAAELPLDRGRPGAVRRPGRRGRAAPTWPRAGCCGAGPTGWYWTDRRRPDLDIRGTGGEPVRGGGGGDRAAARHRGRRGRAPTVHHGAVYLHQGGAYVVDELDLADGRRPGARGRPRTGHRSPRRHRHPRGLARCASGPRRR